MWQCKWLKLVSKFVTNAGGAIWWPNLELMQVVAKFGTNASGAIWWSNLQLMQVVAKFGTNASGTIWWPNINLIQVTESISGSVVPLAMFYICSKRRLSFYPSFDIVSPARALVHIEEWETRIVSMCQECSGSTHSSFCSLFSSSSSLGSKSWDSASRSSPTKPSLKFSTQLLPFA